MREHEHEHEAIIDLIAEGKISVFETINEVSTAEEITGLKEAEDFSRKITFAIVDGDELLVGEAMTELFMKHNAEAIDEKIQELEDNERREQDFNHGIKPSLNPAMDDAGMKPEDFL